VTLDDLGLNARNYATTAEVALLLDGADPRTVRRMAEAGTIPSIRVGTRWMIPTAWLRQHLHGGVSVAIPVPAGPDLDQLADRVADRVATRILGAFAALAPNMAAAGPSPGPAAIASDSPPTKEARRDHHSPAA
jgi:excisionase family DNA binding protein